MLATDLAELDKARLRRRLWAKKARPDQRLPTGDWAVWLCRGGRGSGKTRSGAEGLADMVLGSWEGEGDWAVIAPTFADARDTCIEGPSGLLRTLAGAYEPKRWNRSMGQLHLDNGSVVYCDGADDGAYRIQGKNLRGAWCDEVGLWRIGPQAQRGGRAWWEIAWDESLAFAVRIDPARIIATGTPKRGHPLVKRLLSDPKIPNVRLRTEDNRANLSPEALDRLQERFAGTSLEVQELEGEFLEAPEGALWTQATIGDHRWRGEWGEPNLRRVITGVDPSGGSSPEAGETGIVTAGVLQRCPCGIKPNLAHYAVIADHSLRGSPEARAQAVAQAFRSTGADLVVGERNYGGDIVSAMVRQVGGDRIAYEEVSATRGKAVRAEPIAMLYEQGRVHHLEIFEALEDQLMTWTPDAAWSPDRLDALVWALTKLSERAEGRGKVGRSTYTSRLPEGVGSG